MKRKLKIKDVFFKSFYKENKIYKNKNKKYLI